MKDYGDTNFITGMRAYAALAVVLIHAGGGGLRDIGQMGDNIANLGLAGVYVFFVISGFSVASSYLATDIRVACVWIWCKRPVSLDI